MKDKDMFDSIGDAALDNVTTRKTYSGYGRGHNSGYLGGGYPNYTGSTYYSQKSKIDSIYSQLRQLYWKAETEDTVHEAIDLAFNMVVASLEAAGYVFKSGQCYNNDTGEEIGDIDAVIRQYFCDYMPQYLQREKEKS
jgi:hypothetical protein